MSFLRENCDQHNGIISHRELPPGQFKVDLAIKEGTHSTADEVTKQINDKERVAAALENPNLRETVDNCIKVNQCTKKTSCPKVYIYAFSFLLGT